MKRDVAGLAEKTFDVVVIGGGIHGAATAACAAQCGLSVALLEKEDFCASTSANSLKIIHGGLRYLQHFDVPRILDSIASRRWMLAGFPEVVEPLACLMPTYGAGARGRVAMAMGLAMNEVFSWKKNVGVEPTHHLGRGQVLSRSACARHIPGLDMGVVTGAALWYDALAVNTERSVMELLTRLSVSGGQAINYCPVTDILQHQGKACGVQCLDSESKESFPVRAACVINASGPHIGQFAPIQQEIAGACRQWSRAVNIIVRRQFFEPYGVGLEGNSAFVDQDALVRQGKRLFFFVPWRGKTMIGTLYTAHADPAEQPVVTRATIEEMLAEINRVYPPGALQLQDVVNYHVGLVPSLPGADGGPFDVRLDKKEALLDHGATGSLANLLSIKTVKYTTASCLAARAMDWLVTRGLLTPAQRKRGVAAGTAKGADGGEVVTLPQTLRQ